MTMKSSLRYTVLLATATVSFAAFAAPALAKDICSVPKAQWQGQPVLVKKLEGQGWKIRNMKIDSGCYEVYGTDGNGKFRETHFNPATLQAVAEKHRS